MPFVSQKIKPTIINRKQFAINGTMQNIDLKDALQ
ncbi:unnamed protein product [Brugia timori]|uniref:Transposase n=1 Tax=Brugia timori TaxID=42155 RepID=A0A0R3QNF9_9BILA|nr:unnamed protein product [Brugia timori]